MSKIGPQISLVNHIPKCDFQRHQNIALFNSHKIAAHKISNQIISLDRFLVSKKNAMAYKVKRVNQPH